MTEVKTAPKMEFSAKGPWIVWVDYGQEGWSPRSFTNEEDAVGYIMSGETGANPIQLTKRYHLVAVDERANGPYYTG